MGNRQRAVIQMAYVTRSLDESVDYWTKILGAGPFFYSDVYAPSPQTYRGNESDIKFRIACGYSGDMHIELLEQLGEAPSPFTEVLVAGTKIPKGGAFHHVQLALEDYDRFYEDLLGAGAERCFDAVVPLGRFCFIDARALMGCFAELVEPNEISPKLRARMRDLHRGWDGAEPKRKMSELL